VRRSSRRFASARIRAHVFLTGVAKYLSSRWRSGVVCHVASYLLSRTLIPTMVMFIMRGHEHRALEPTNVFAKFQRQIRGWFEKVRGGVPAIAGKHAGAPELRCRLTTFCVLSMIGVFYWGRTFFRRWIGPIRLHFRARSGLRWKKTAVCCGTKWSKCLRSGDPEGRNCRPLVDKSAFPTRASISPTEFGRDRDERCGDP